METVPFSGVPVFLDDGSEGEFSGTAHTVFMPKGDDTALIQLSFNRTTGEWTSGPLEGTSFCAIEMNSAKTVALPGDDADTLVTFRALNNPCRGQRTAFEGPLTAFLSSDGDLTIHRVDLAPRDEDDGRVVL